MGAIRISMGYAHGPAELNLIITWRKIYGATPHTRGEDSSDEVPSGSVHAAAALSFLKETRGLLTWTIKRIVAHAT